MLFYFDTEFTGLVPNTEIISIGIVSSKGDRFYGEFSDYDFDKVDDWLKENVISKLIFNREQTSTKMKVTVVSTNNNGIGYPNALNALPKGTRYVYGDKAYVSEAINTWVKSLLEDGEYAVMVADVGYYDMYLFTSIFGGSFQMPEYFAAGYYDMNSVIGSMNNFATIEESVIRGFDIDRESLAPNTVSEYGSSLKHNALYDAMVLKEIGDTIGFNN